MTEKLAQGAPHVVWNVTDAVKARIAIQCKRAAGLTKAEFQQIAWFTHVQPNASVAHKDPNPFVFMDSDNVRTSALARW